MRKDRCPHCGEYGFHFWNLHEDVVAVLTCEACDALSLFFRDRVIPLNKQILESGTLEERKSHLADVIGILLEAGMLNLSIKKNDLERLPEEKRQRERPRDADAGARKGLISDREVERFLRIELNRLDNPAYFKRFFG